nr:antA/AntB antirepressor family protein [Novosphingobium panipatense]
MTTKDIAEALTPVEQNGEPMIDARSLHQWLGIGRVFSSWFRALAKDYEFIEGADYTPVSVHNTGKRGKPRKDYLLTTSVAKEVAMIGNTPTGRATRRYFIQMEQAALKMAADHVAAGTPEAIPQEFFDARELKAQMDAIHAKLDKLISPPALPGPKEPVLGPLPEWVTARAAAERLGILDLRLPTSAVQGVVSKVGRDYSPVVRNNAGKRGQPHNKDLRGVVIDGEPWFLVKDATNILGHSNTTVALSSLEDDEKGLLGKPLTLSAGLLGYGGGQEIVSARSSPGAFPRNGGIVRSFLKLVVCENLAHPSREVLPIPSH